MNETKQILVVLVMALAAMAPHQTPAAAGPPPIDLGSAAHFVILAGTAITGGGGLITGDVGLSPTTGAAIMGLSTAQVNGIIYAVDAGGPAGSAVDPGRLTAAMTDLTAAYNDAAGRTNVDGVYPASREIGGTTLVPGLYKFTSTAYITGTNVTLTGGPNDVWIFQIGSTLTVNSGILLAGGAQARNIFWQVGTSATVGSSAVFKGTIMANAAITMDAGSTMEGRALTFTAVTFNTAASGSLPTPEAPIFTRISSTNTSSVTVVLYTTPYFPLTLKTCPNLLLTNWTTIATETPVTNFWGYTDNTVMATVTQRFYRAFITP